MYYLFAAKGWRPSAYYDRPQGEKDLIWALASYESNERAAERGQKGRRGPVRRMKGKPPPRKGRR